MCFQALCNKTSHSTCSSFNVKDTPSIKTLVLLPLCQSGDTVCYVASKANSEKQYNFCLSLDMLVFETQPPWCRIPKPFQTMKNTHTHFLVDDQLRSPASTPRWRHLKMIITALRCVLSPFSCVRLFVTLWAVAHQSPLSMAFSGKSTGEVMSYQSIAAARVFSTSCTCALYEVLTHRISTHNKTALLRY